MSSNSIANDIKHTGWVIRDWLGPYYMLGGAVAFGIGMLTLLDQDGTLHLTRIVGAILFVATLIAWAHYFYKQRAKQQSASGTANTANSAPSTKLHGVLLAVTVFFMAGIVVSEALMKNHRSGIQVPVPTVPVTKADVAATQNKDSEVNAGVANIQTAQSVGVAPFVLNTENPEVVAFIRSESTSAQSATTITVPAGTNVPAASAVQKHSNTSSDTVQGDAVKLAAPQPEHQASMAPSTPKSVKPSVAESPVSPSSSVEHKKSRQPQAGAGTAVAAVQVQTKPTKPLAEPKPATTAAPYSPENAARCQALNAQFSQGGDLAAEDLNFMRNACRRK